MPATFISIDTVQKLDAVIAESHLRPVFLFKHSDRCGISADVKSQIDSFGGEVHIIVVQADRPVSNAVVEKLGIRHASPQAFVLRDGKPVYHATHYGIDPAEIAKHL